MGKRAARLLCSAAAASTLVWTLGAVSLRGPEGALSGAACLPLTCALALALAGAGLGTRYRRFALWVGVALIGQAVTLQMIDAGHAMRYQHYQPLTVLWRTRPWLLAAIGAQGALVAAALIGRARRRSGGLPRAIAGWPLAVAGVLSLSTAATVSPTVSRYLSELVFAASLQVLGAATIVATVLAFPTAQLAGVQRWLDRLLGVAGEASPAPSLRPDRLAWSGAFAVTVVAVALNLFSYQRHPHIKDEVVYLYHARYLAGGMLTMAPPPVPAAFDVELMNYEPSRWFCPVPPGWPAVLALGVGAGVPWLINPVLGGLNVLLMFMLLRDLYDRRTARLGVLLLCLSPWHVFLAMSFMTHTLTLTCGLLAVLGVILARRTGHARWALLAGCAVGATSLIRPLDGVIIGAPIALWSMGVGGARLRIAPLTALLVGTVAVGSVTFPYNRILTGHALEFPINAYNDKYHGHNSNAYGFGPDRGFGWAIDPYPGHGPLDATINANLNAFSINIELFGWSTGSLVFVALLLCSRSLGRSDALMIAVAVTVFVAYFFYYFSGGPDFGARYWFLMIVPLVALTARGVQWLERVGGGPRVVLAVLVLSTMAAVNYFPWRAIDKYYHYLDMRPDVRQLASQHRFDGALVLVQGRRFPDYAAAAIENPLDLAGSQPIYAWDQSPAVRAAVLRAYPTRPVWVLEGPTLTHAGYRIVRGPLPAGSLAHETERAP